MPMTCKVCNHPKRLEIDREIVQGKSYQGIAREYDLHSEAVRRHAENHLSRQLCQAWEKKEMAESTDMLAKIDRILSRAERIYKEAYKEKKHNTALNALKEQRSTIELLAKISYFLHQAKAAELQRAELEREDSLSVKQEDLARKAAEVLSDAELDMLIHLTKKANGELPATYEVVPDDDEYDFSDIVELGPTESSSNHQQESEPPKMTRNNPPTKPAYQHQAFEIPDSGRSSKLKRILG